MSTAPLQETSRTATAEQAADEFGSLLKKSFNTRSDHQTTEVENAVSTLVSEALRDTSLIKGEAIETIEAMIAAIDRQLSAQVNEIIHAEEFQKIESAWRGLHHLVYHSETDANLKIRVLNTSKKELLKDLRRYPGAKWDQSPLFRKVYEEEFGQFGGQPYGCLIGDYYFTHDSQDVELMRGLSKIAASAHAPFFAAADPVLLNIDNWNQIGKQRDLSTLFDRTEYVAWRSLRDSEDTRYLGLCLPRVLARLPYGAKTEPVDEFAFEEDTDGHNGEKYSWMNAAYAMGVNINRAFKEFGWCTRIRGPESGGTVEFLPTHLFPTDDGSVDQKCPTEVAISDRREHELAKSGLIPLIHRKNTDKAAFMGAQSVYKPKKTMKVEATASENMSARLPYMFAVSRFAHYLKCMVRDKVGSTKEKEQLRRWLQEWINLYVDPNPEMSTEIQKARQPLAEAKVTVEPDEENPGYYTSRFYIKPHFQLEGMNIGMSLVSRLPKDEG